MLLLQQLTLSVLAVATANAQSYSEPADFEPINALADLGVDVSTIPGLDSWEALSSRADTPSCAIAVSNI
jgi:hypothetical protein